MLCFIDIENTVSVNATEKAFLVFNAICVPNDLSKGFE